MSGSGVFINRTAAKHLFYDIIFVISLDSLLAGGVHRCAGHKEFSYLLFFDYGGATKGRENLSCVNIGICFSPSNSRHGHSRIFCLVSELVAPFPVSVR